MELNTTNILNAVMGAFAQEIARQVSAAIEPEIDRLRERCAALEGELTTMRAAGSSLSHLLLDDPDYAARLNQFVIDRITQHENSQPHLSSDWVTEAADRVAKENLPDTDSLFRDMEDDIDTLVDRKLRDHTEEHDHSLLVDDETLERKITEKIGEDATIRCVVDEIESRYGEEMANAIVDDSNAMDKLTDALRDTGSLSSPIDETQVANIAGSVITEKLRLLMHEMTHAAVRTLDREVVR